MSMKSVFQEYNFNSIKDVQIGMNVIHRGSGNSSRIGWRGVITEIISEPIHQRGIRSTYDTSGISIYVRYPEHKTEFGETIVQKYTANWFLANMRRYFNVPQDDLYILWTPDSDTPPRKCWTTYQEAAKVQTIMQDKYDKQFFVMKAITGAPVMTRTDVTIEFVSDEPNTAYLLSIGDVTIEITKEQYEKLENGHIRMGETELSKVLKLNGKYYAADEIKVD